MIKRLFYFLACTLLFIACGGGGGDDGGGGTPSGGSEYLNVRDVQVKGDQTEAILSIQASNNCDWIISYNDPMIRNITPTKGRGPQDVTVQLYENPKTSERSATITVKNTSGTITRNPVITQLGSTESISLSETSINFSSSAESKQITVSSNTHWTITGKTNWMTISPETGDGNGTVTIIVQENTGSERSAILTFKASESKTAELTIKQAGTAAPATKGVASPQVSNIGKHEADVAFTYNWDTAITEYGVCYSTSGDPSVEKDAHVSKSCSESQGSVTMQLTNLASATTYYVRAYIITNGGTQYSNSTSFTTETSYPGGDDNPTP